MRLRRSPATRLLRGIVTGLTALALLLGVAAPSAVARGAAADMVIEVDFVDPAFTDAMREHFGKAVASDLGIPGFKGTVHVADTVVAFTIPAADVEASTTWRQGIIAAATGTVVGALITSFCLVYMPAAGFLCGGLGGFFGDLLNNVISQAFDGQLKDPEAWANTAARSIVVGLVGAGMGKAVEPVFPQVVEKIAQLLVKTGEKIRGWWSGAGELMMSAAWPFRWAGKKAWDLLRQEVGASAACPTPEGGTGGLDWKSADLVDNIRDALDRLKAASRPPSAGMTPSPGEATAAPRYPDLTGTGRADRVLVTSGGRVDVGQNAGCDPKGARVMYPTGSAGPATSVPAGLSPDRALFGDLDGDDRDDYVLALDAADSPTGTAGLFAWRNDSRDGWVRWAAEPVRVSDDLGYVTGLSHTFADIDGDGDDDYLVTGPGNAVTVRENTARGLPAPADWRRLQGFGHPGEGRAGQEARFADITGDGRADLLLLDLATGDTEAWENTGGPWTRTAGWKSLGILRTGTPLASRLRADVDFADLDGDRVADLLLFDRDSRSLSAWMLPRYGAGPQGPGQPGQPVPPGDLPPGTLPAYGGGQPQPQTDGRLLQNSNFTTTDKPWWVNAGMTPRLENGAFCVTVPASAKPWDVLVGHNSIYLPGQSSYTLRFKARTSANASLVVQVAPFDNPTNQTHLVKYPTVTAGAWKTYEYTFDTTFRDAYVLSQLQFRLGGASAPYEFCMDDVTLNGPEYAYRAKTGPAVKVNQHGYLPGGPKRATVVTGASSPQPWTLRRVGGATVASGTTVPGGYDASAAASVHLADFSGVTATGTFQLVVGGETSHPFDIRKDLYASLRTDAMRFFYTNRSGIAIDGGIAGAAYARPAGHVASSPGGGDTKVPCQSPKPYVDNWTCDYTLDVTGGWYDAGDHGKYVVNGGIATHQLLSTWERAVAMGSQAALGDSTLAVPERGNGVPDVLDEARWNLEFMLKMQVPAGRPLAGMVHHKVHDESWTGPPTLPHLDRKKRELHRPSTAATLNLAAVAAQGARIYEQSDPAFATKLRTAATRAYAAARANPALYAPRADRVGGGPYDDSDVTDEFYWAATELYLTTKGGEYLDAVRSSRFHKAGAAFSQNGFYWGSVAALGQMSLARFGGDLPEHPQIRGWVTAAADHLVSFQRAERFGQTYTPTTGRYDWGSNASIMNNQVVLATAYDLTGTRAYADAVFEAFDHLLGRNALGQSYITGYGTNDAKNQHSRWYAKSLDAALPNPPAGSVSGGPNSSLQDPLAASWLHNCAPQLCYVDNIEAWSVNEITINWNSALAWVSAFAADVGARA